MPIVSCSNTHLDQAESLVRSVFPSMSPVEHLSFLAFRRPKSLAGRIVMLFAGIKDIVLFDVFVSDKGETLGTTGLYRYHKDAAEAVWVAWFCVDPLARGKGIGQALIEHTISRAREAGFPRIRLYTSTSPNESSAQRLYERNGFQEVGRKKGLFGTTIFREMCLQ